MQHGSRSLTEVNLFASQPDRLLCNAGHMHVVVVLPRQSAGLCSLMPFLQTCLGILC